MSEFCTGKKALIEEEEFQEEEMWAVMKDSREGSNLKLKIGKGSSFPSPTACRIPGLPRVIPKANSGYSFDSRVLMVHQHQSSAPSKIPGWSKICRSKKSDGTNKKNSRADAWGAAAAVDDDHGRYFGDFEECEDDEDDDEMIPPHEFIARRVARSPIVSSSMCEGIGRTLKGRDLSTVRNAILSKTGFLEQ